MGRQHSRCKEREDTEGKKHPAWYEHAETALDLAKVFGCDDSLRCGLSKHSQIVVIIEAEDQHAYSIKSTKSPILKHWLVWSDIGIVHASDRSSVYGYILCQRLLLVLSYAYPFCLDGLSPSQLENQYQRSYSCVVRTNHCHF